MYRLLLFSILTFWIGMSVSQPILSVDEINEKARTLSKSDPDSALNLLKEGLILAFEQNDEASQAKTLNNLGILYRRTGRYEEAIESYEKALELQTKLENEKEIAKINENLGHLYHHQGDYDTSLEFHLESLEIRKHLNDERGLARCYDNLGSICTIRKFHDKALSYFNESLRLRKQMDDQGGIAAVSNNLGNLYFEMGAFDSAYQYHHESLIISGNLDDTTGMADALNNLGRVMTQRQDYEKALTYHRQALDLRMDMNDLEGELDSRINIGVNHERMGHFQEAVGSYIQALELAKQTNAADDLQDSYHNLFAVHYQLGKYEEALDYHRQYVNVKDSVFEQTTQTQLAEAAIKFEQAQTQQLLAETQQKLAEEKTARMFLVGGIVILVLLVFMAGILGYTVFQHQKSQRLKVEHKHKMNQQLIVDLLKNQEVESLNSVVEGQEKERQRIAEDLHDSLGGTLAAVKVSLYTLHKKISDQPETTLFAFNQTNKLLEDACEEVRRISHDLGDNTLEETGLVPAITKMYDTLNQSNQFEMTMETSGMDGERFERTVEINLYRIVQELFQNIVKHAEASRVSIYLNRFDDHLNILVEDNGIGFTYEPTRRPKTMGLGNIASRVRKLNGTLTIDTAPGEGTTTEIGVPV